MTLVLIKSAPIAKYFVPHTCINCGSVFMLYSEKDESVQVEFCHLCENGVA